MFRRVLFRSIVRDREWGQLQGAQFDHTAISRTMPLQVAQVGATGGHGMAGAGAGPQGQFGLGTQAQGMSPMVGVFMGDEHRVQIIHSEITGAQALVQFTDPQPAVDQHAAHVVAVPGFHQGRIA